MTDDTEDLDRSLTGLYGRVDPVPPTVISAARSAYTWRTIDAELAELTFDSELTPEGAGRRGMAAVDRELTFTAGPCTVELSVGASSGPTKTLVGQVVPADATEVVAHSGGGERRAPVDEIGRFRIEGVAPGPVRLVVQLADARSISTDWFIAR